jgi:hypothetical protein
MSDDDTDEYTKKKNIIYNRRFVLYIEPMVMLDNHFFRLFSNNEPINTIEIKMHQKSKKKFFYLNA